MRIRRRRARGRCGSSIASIRGALARPSSRATTRLSLTRTSVGTSATSKRSARSGCASTSTRRTRSRRAPCARDGPGGCPSAGRGPSARTLKKTSKGRVVVHELSSSRAVDTASVLYPQKTQPRNAGPRLYTGRDGRLVQDRPGARARRRRSASLAGAARGDAAAARSRSRRARRGRGRASSGSHRRLGEVAAGAVGGRRSARSRGIVVAGALRARRDAGGIGVLVAAVAARLAALAFVPVSAISRRSAVPVLAARCAGAQVERYAGLRSLARD